MRARSRAVAFLVLLSVVACASGSSPEVRQFQAIETCNLAAQSAARGFGVLYQQKKAENPALWQDRYDKAQAAYEAYQKIALAAADAAKSGGDTALVLAAVNEALNQLLLLLSSYGVR